MMNPIKIFITTEKKDKNGDCRTISVTATFFGIAALTSLASTSGRYDQFGPIISG